MKQRVLVFNIDEFAIDYIAVAASINEACKRGGAKLKVTGLCQTFKNVYVPLGIDQSVVGVRYVLAPFSGTSGEEVEADLFTRWSSGFSTKGLIRLSESFLGLFEMEENSPKNL